MEGKEWRAVGIERTMGIERAMGIETAGFCGLFRSTERSVFPAWGGEEEEKREERKEDSIEELERAKPGVVGKLSERLEIATRGIRKTSRSILAERVLTRKAINAGLFSCGRTRRALFCLQ